MHEIKTSILIQETPEKVWEVLADFSAYPEWNPFIIMIEGALRERETIRIRIQPPGAGAMTFKPEIISLLPGKELVWKGKLWVKGLFDGEHRLALEKHSQGTLFVHAERFSGLLVSPLRSTLAKTEQGFRAMNEALKRRVEIRQPLR